MTSMLNEGNGVDHAATSIDRPISVVGVGRAQLQYDLGGNETVYGGRVPKGRWKQTDKNQCAPTHFECMCFGDELDVYVRGIDSARLLLARVNDDRNLLSSSEVKPPLSTFLMLLLGSYSLPPPRLCVALRLMMRARGKSKYDLKTVVCIFKGVVLDERICDRVVNQEERAALTDLLTVDSSGDYPAEIFQILFPFLEGEVDATYEIGVIDCLKAWKEIWKSSADFFRMFFVDSGGNGKRKRVASGEETPSAQPVDDEDSTPPEYALRGQILEYLSNPQSHKMTELVLRSVSRMRSIVELEVELYRICEESKALPRDEAETPAMKILRDADAMELLGTPELAQSLQDAREASASILRVIFARMHTLLVCEHCSGGELDGSGSAGRSKRPRPEFSGAESKQSVRQTRAVSRQRKSVPSPAPAPVVEDTPQRILLESDELPPIEPVGSALELDDVVARLVLVKEEIDKVVGPVVEKLEKIEKALLAFVWDMPRSIPATGGSAACLSTYSSLEGPIHPGGPSASFLAERGFFLVKDIPQPFRNVVQCRSCGLTLFLWVSGAEVDAVHARCSEKCALVTAASDTVVSRPAAAAPPAAVTPALVVAPVRPTPASPGAPARKRASAGPSPSKDARTASASATHSKGPDASMNDGNETSPLSDFGDIRNTNAAGEVYIMRKKSTGNYCVLKVIQSRSAFSAEAARARALKLQKVSHENVLSLSGAFLTLRNGAICACIVADYFANPTAVPSGVPAHPNLDTLTTIMRGGANLQSVAARCHILADIAEGLSCLHGWAFYHLALNPDNIFIAPNFGDPARSVRAVIGFPGLEDAPADTGLSTVPGRPLLFCPPERTREGCVSVEDHGEADVWALGCLFVAVACWDSSLLFVQRYPVSPEDFVVFHELLRRKLAPTFLARHTDFILQMLSFLPTARPSADVVVKLVTVALRHASSSGRGSPSVPGFGAEAAPLPGPGVATPRSGTVSPQLSGSPVVGGGLQGSPVASPQQLQTAVQAGAQQGTRNAGNVPIAPAQAGGSPSPHLALLAHSTMRPLAAAARDQMAILAPGQGPTASRDPPSPADQLRRVGSPQARPASPSEPNGASTTAGVGTVPVKPHGVPRELTLSVNSVPLVPKKTKTLKRGFVDTLVSCVKRQQLRMLAIQEYEKRRGRQDWDSDSAVQLAISRVQIKTKILRKFLSTLPCLHDFRDLLWRGDREEEEMEALDEGVTVSHSGPSESRNTVNRLRMEGRTLNGGREAIIEKFLVDVLLDTPYIDPENWFTIMQGRARQNRGVDRKFEIAKRVNSEVEIGLQNSRNLRIHVPLASNPERTISVDGTDLFLQECLDSDVDPDSLGISWRQLNLIVRMFKAEFENRFSAIFELRHGAKK